MHAAIPRVVLMSFPFHVDMQHARSLGQAAGVLVVIEV